MLFWIIVIIVSLALAIPEEETYTIWGFPNGPEGEKFEGSVKLFYSRAETLNDQILDAAKNLGDGDKAIEEYVTSNMYASENAQRHIRREKLFEEWKKTLVERSIPLPAYKMSLPPIDSMTWMYRTDPEDQRFTGPMSILEVGSYRGGSAMWFSEFALNHPDSKLVCIDAWVTPTGARDTALITEFISNVQSSKNSDKVYALQADSAFGLAALTELKYEFDLVLIDGSHLMLDVLHDALLAFGMLKPGGTLVFDDYGCNPWSPAQGRTKEGIDAFVKVHRDALVDIHYYPDSPVQVVSFTKVIPAVVPAAHPLAALRVLVSSVASRLSVHAPTDISIMAIAGNAEEVGHWVLDQARLMGAPVSGLDLVNRIGGNETYMAADRFPQVRPGVLRLQPAGTSTRGYLAQRIAKFDRSQPQHDIVFLSGGATVSASEAMHSLMTAMYLLRVGGYIVIDNAAARDNYPSGVLEVDQAWFGYDSVLTSATEKLLDISGDTSFASNGPHCFRIFRYMHNRFRHPNSEFRNDLAKPGHVTLL